MGTIKEKPTVLQYDGVSDTWEICFSNNEQPVMMDKPRDYDDATAKKLFPFSGFLKGPDKYSVPKAFTEASFWQLELKWSMAHITRWQKVLKTFDNSVEMSRMEKSMFDNINTQIERWTYFSTLCEEVLATSLPPPLALYQSRRDELKTMDTTIERPMLRTSAERKKALQMPPFMSDLDLSTLRGFRRQPTRKPIAVHSNQTSHSPPSDDGRVSSSSSAGGLKDSDTSASSLPALQQIDDRPISAASGESLSSGRGENVHEEEMSMRPKEESDASRAEPSRLDELEAAIHLDGDVTEKRKRTKQKRGSKQGSSTRGKKRGSKTGDGDFAIREYTGRKLRSPSAEASGTETPAGQRRSQRQRKTKYVDDISDEDIRMLDEEEASKSQRRRANRRRKSTSELDFDLTGLSDDDTYVGGALNKEANTGQRKVAEAENRRKSVVAEDSGEEMKVNKEADGKENQSKAAEKKPLQRARKTCGGGSAQGKKAPKRKPASENAESSSNELTKSASRSQENRGEFATQMAAIPTLGVGFASLDSSELSTSRQSQLSMHSTKLSNDNVDEGEDENSDEEESDSDSECSTALPANFDQLSSEEQKRIKRKINYRLRREKKKTAKKEAWEVRTLREVEGRYRHKTNDIYDLLTHYMWINTTIHNLSENPFCARATMQTIKQGADRVLIYLHQETKVNLKKSAQDLKTASEAVVRTVGSNIPLPIGPPPEFSKTIDTLPEDFDLNNFPWLQDNATAMQSHRSSTSPNSTVSVSSPRRPHPSVSVPSADAAATPALPSTSIPPVFPSFPATGFGLDPATLAALAQLQQQIPTSSALPPFFPSTQQLLQLSAFPGLFPSTTPAAVPTSSAANTSGYPYLPGIMPFVNPQLMQQYAALLQAQTQAIANYASTLPSTSLPAVSPAPVISSIVSTPAIGLSDSSQSTSAAPSTSTSTAAAVPATTHKSKSLKKKKEIEKSVMNILQSASQLVEKEQRGSRKRSESPGSHHSTSGTQPKKRRSSTGKKESSSREAKKPKRQNARRAEKTPSEDEFSE